MNKTIKVERVGMIASGCGVTPMFGLINKSIATKFDGLGLSLIYYTEKIVST
jgi:hypothetical protein